MIGYYYEVVDCIIMSGVKLFMPLKSQPRYIGLFTVFKENKYTRDVREFYIMLFWFMIIKSGTRLFFAFANAISSIPATLI